MISAKGTPIVFINLAGAALTAACWAGVTWFIGFYGDNMRSQCREYRCAIESARTELAQLGASRAQDEQKLVAVREQMSDRGKLPEITPIEDYFQLLSRLADQHALTVVRNNPLSARQYPGLLEQRFVYEVTGSTTEIVDFLRDIEQTDYWADVGYLKIERATQNGLSVPQREAALTFSLFSALPSEPKVGGG